MNNLTIYIILQKKSFADMYFYIYTYTYTYIIVY